MNSEILLDKLQNDAVIRGIYSAVCKKDFKSYVLTMYYLVNGSKYIFKPFHEKVMTALQNLVDGKNIKRNLALCLPVGCVTGDTVIRYNRATLGRKITIKDLYEKQNNISKRYKWDLSIPTYVRSFIEKDDKIRLNEVDCVTYSGKKKVYRLTLEDGKSLKATIEHKIMTDKGFIELGALKVGDMVMVDNIVGKKKKEVSEAKSRKNRGEKTKCVGKYHPYSKCSDGYSWRVEYHRALYEAHLNNMSLEDFCYACKFPNELKFIDPKIYHIHHIDHNHSNNVIENLQCLTKEEHCRLHGNYNHFGHGKPEYSAVVSVEEVGIEDTYDITCFDNHNFNANDIIVHNSGKSILVEYFITWCFARSINNMFVYTAYSDRLINKLSKETKDIIEHPAWQLLFMHFLKKDDRQKINYSFQGAKNRTGLAAGTTNSALTGLDCFSGDTQVLTEEGFLPLEGLVELEIPIKLLSYNLKENKLEYKDVYRHIKKEKSTLIQLTLSDGSVIKCTPTHKFYTQRGYVMAKDLRFDDILPSNLVNHTDTCAKLGGKLFLGFIACYNFVNFFLRKTSLRGSFLPSNPYAFCEVAPIFPTFNRCYMPIRNAVVDGYEFIRSRVFGYIDCLRRSNLMALISPISSSDSHSSMFNSIFNVFPTSSISKVFKPIIKWVSVKMSDIHSNLLLAHESFKNKLMDKKLFMFCIRLAQADNKISSCGQPWFKFSPFVSLPPSLLKICPSFTSDFSAFGDTVKPLVFGNRKPLFINFVTHNKTSFCLSVQDNCNLLIKTSQGVVLASNCGHPSVDGFSGALIIDDPSSADEIIYPNARETIIRTYDEKLATRRRTANTPTILIMQRLHVDDLVGWTKQTEPDQWEYVEVPALDKNDNSFWEERYPAEELKRMRDINSYKFQAQYQQNPIIAGGQIIKSEWFQYYQSHPHYTKIFITSDTAMKTGQHNDFSVFMVWGVYEHNLYLIDMLRGKWEAPDLLKQVKDLTNKYYLWENRLRMSSLYIEDKASGVGLVQQMKRESRVPIIPITPTKDKVSRVEEILPILQAGRVYLPFGKDYGFNVPIISECEQFARDMSHGHDDIVDCISQACNVYCGLSRAVSIFET